MRATIQSIVRFLKADEGPTAVEYAMLMLLVFLALLSAVIYLGQATSTNFQNSSQSIEAATAGPS
jgi:pilus assembly protein Flp/PilA